AEPQVQGLWQALRRNLQRGEGRLLRHRPHVVQPRHGDGDGTQVGQELRGWPYRRGRALALLLLTRMMAASPDTSIVLFGDGRDWHGKSLRKAFKKRGISPHAVPLNICGFSTTTATGLAIPGLGDALPEGAFVRFVPGGTFEEVTLYLGVLHALRELGVTVWNDARAIERCVDKSTTTFFLQREGLPTPPTFACVDPFEAAAIAARVLGEGNKLVQKPLFGAQGKGLRLISSISDLAPPEEVNGVYYL